MPATMLAVVHHSKIDRRLAAMGLGRVKTKPELVVMPSGRQIFTQPGSKRECGRLPDVVGSNDHLTAIRRRERAPSTTSKADICSAA